MTRDKGELMSDCHQAIEALETRFRTIVPKLPAPRDAARVEVEAANATYEGKVRLLVDDLREFHDSLPVPWRWKDILTRLEPPVQPCPELLLHIVPKWLEQRLSAAKEGSFEAYTVLWLLIEKRIWGYLSGRITDRDARKDILETVMMRLFHGKKPEANANQPAGPIKNYDPDKSNLATYTILFVARQCVAEYLRDLGRLVPLSDDDGGFVAPVTPAQLFIYEALWCALWKCRRPHQRICFAYGHLWDWIALENPFPNGFVESEQPPRTVGDTNLLDYLEPQRAREIIAGWNYWVKRCVATQVLRDLFPDDKYHEDLRDLTEGPRHHFNAKVEPIVSHLLEVPLQQLASRLYENYQKRSDLKDSLLEECFQPMLDELAQPFQK